MFNTLYLLLPAYIANMTPVFARKLKITAPMDFGVSLNDERLFGKNKTWAGFIVGVAAGTLFGVLISKIYWPFSFSAYSWTVLASLGALTGDLIKSFFKRRMKIKSGKPWIPFDQIDFSVGAFAFGSLIYFPGWLLCGSAVLISAGLHVIVNHLAFYLKIRGEKW